MVHYKMHHVVIYSSYVLLFLYLFHFSHDEENNQWIAEALKYPYFKAVSNAGSVLGPQEWTVHNDSKLCSGSVSYTAMLSFSSCSEHQFTCSDGNCVDMDKRYNDIF